MILLFYISIAFNSVYFLFFKRSFDFFSLAFLSSIVYFMPGFFGIDLWGQSLNNKVYIVFIIVELFLFFGSLFQNIILEEQIGKSPELICGQNIYFTIISYIGLSIILYIILTKGINIFFIPKTQMHMDGKLLILWRITASFSFIYGYTCKDKQSFLIGLLLLAITFISGDRTALTLSVLAILLIQFNNQGKVNFIKTNFKKSLILLIFTIFILFGKLFQSISYLMQNNHSFTEAVYINFYNINFIKLFSHTEPFVIQLILNKVTSLNYIINSDYIYSIFTQFLPINLGIGYKSTIFNDFIQKDIFTMFKTHSIAYNYWAEAYAINGWLGIIFFSTFFVIIIIIYNIILMKSINSITKITISLVGSYHVFYIHRNSLFSIISYEKQIIYFSILIYIIYLLLKKSKLIKISTKNEIS